MTAESSPAVFLSYAREDTDAAKRIADALRAFGVEVWFDQRELRGGDTWDEKIRGQIRTCTLFVPVISARTQARREGYFRREWKLAVERTHDMAEGVPFIAPVVIDDTAESAAVAPAEFLRVQWMRLPGALPTPEFIEQLKRLLATQAVAAAAPVPLSMRAATGPIAAAPAAATRPAGSSVPSAVIAALAALVLTLVGYILLRPRATEPAKPVATKSAEPNSVPSPTAPVVTLAASKSSDKSIAVLPFKNQSPDKENAFFTDGVHEDILTNLGNIRDLRVISRTSVEQYRETTKTIRQIGAELGVIYILEGSVQRAGNKVHVTGQLIDARSDAHLWAKAYDKDLSDIFVIQAELAKAIAAELQSALSPQEKKLIERRPTTNIAAYELVLKSREWSHHPTATRKDLLDSRQLLEDALKLDPNYGVAYADLAYNYLIATRYGSLSGRTQFAPAEDLEKSREMIEHAARVAPDSPEVLRARGDYYYYGFGDFAHALEQYEKLRELRPNDPVYFNRVGSIRRRQSRWLEALENFRRLEELDLGMLRYRRDTALLLAAGRRYDEAIAQQERVVEQAPGDLEARFELASLHYVATGSTREVEQFFAGLTSDQANSDVVRRARKTWALRRGDVSDSIRLNAIRPTTGDTEFALALASEGKLDGARAQVAKLLDELRASVRDEPLNFAGWGELGLVAAISGQREEAIRSAKKAVELMPVTSDALSGGGLRSNLALVYAWCGDKDSAIAEYTQLFRIPYGISGSAGNFPRASIHTMRLDPTYAPLRDDPRWEALLSDPKNNQPLF
jgi:TolB-like protein/Flp pilus assembly protein TadD